MIAPKIILHLGLPKTATSSLQHNVFQKLHKESRINFLGKCLDYDYKTGNVEIFNYSGKFIRDAAEGIISIEDARQQLTSSLSLNCINVFSDEGVMVAYPGKKNLMLSEKFGNLAKVFEGYDVKVVVTLRDPVDYLYSLYVQIYPDICSKIKELNSIEKYVGSLLSNPDNVLFESFFFDQWLPCLKNEFDVTVFQYDQLVSKNPLVYQNWAKLLGLPTDEFREYFDSKKVNVKNKTGREVKKVRDFRGVENKLASLFSRSRMVFEISKWLYKMLRLKKILSYRFSTSETHHYPEGEVYERLQKLLG